MATCSPALCAKADDREQRPLALSGHAVQYLVPAAADLRQVGQAAQRGFRCQSAGIGFLSSSRNRISLGQVGGLPQRSPDVQRPLYLPRRCINAASEQATDFSVSIMGCGCRRTIAGNACGR